MASGSLCKFPKHSYRRVSKPVQSRVDSWISGSKRSCSQSLANLVGKTLEHHAETDVSLSDSLVSVTIPTLNSADTLDKCLSSVREQSHPLIEIVIMDGGSSDSSLAIAQRYGARVLSGGSLAERRLDGVRASQGQFVLM